MVAPADTVPAGYRRNRVGGGDRCDGNRHGRHPGNQQRRDKLRLDRHSGPPEWASLASHSNDAPPVRLLGLPETAPERNAAPTTPGPAKLRVLPRQPLLDVGTYRPLATPRRD